MLDAWLRFSAEVREIRALGPLGFAHPQQQKAAALLEEADLGSLMAVAPVDEAPKAKGAAKAKPKAKASPAPPPPGAPAARALAQLVESYVARAESPSKFPMEWPVVPYREVHRNLQHALHSEQHGFTISVNFSVKVNAIAELVAIPKSFAEATCLRRLLQLAGYQSRQPVLRAEWGESGQCVSASGSNATRKGNVARRGSGNTCRWLEGSTCWGITPGAAAGSFTPQLAEILRLTDANRSL